MGKPTLVRRPDDAQARSPEREALAAAIANHEALKAAVAENLVSQRRAEAAKFTAIRANDAANKGVEIAKAADAESIAAGTAVGAVKTARHALQDADDTLEAARSAEILLTDQHADLTNRLSIADLHLKDAVAVVVRNQVAAFIERYEEARHKFHDLHGVLGVLFTANALPRELNVAVQNVDINQVVHRDLPPSPLAAKVRDWIERLRTDPDVLLKFDG
jgi:hypothetical protein